MADSMISMENIKAFWHSQVHDEQQWAQNMVTSLSLYICIFMDYMPVSLYVHGGVILLSYILYACIFVCFAVDSRIADQD